MLDVTQPLNQNPGETQYWQADLSQTIALLILAFIKNHVHLLLPKYQVVNWDDLKHYQTLYHGVQAKLASQAHGKQVVVWLHQYIFPLLFQPSILQQPGYQALVRTLSNLLGSNSNDSPHADLRARTWSDRPALSPTSWEKANGFRGSGKASIDNEIAILLLDAENLDLSTEEEEFLQRNCSFPIKVKIAFANWRSLGKRDERLHDRGYDLIHVPKGKSHADGKMLVVGSSIHECYPQVRAVIVCSSDTIMKNLHNRLIQNRLEVYTVARPQAGIEIYWDFNGKQKK